MRYFGPFGFCKVGLAFYLAPAFEYSQIGYFASIKTFLCDKTLLFLRSFAALLAWRLSFG
jgi:hypothetical protein